MSKNRISKSEYMRGIQYIKSLWLYNYRKDLVPEVSTDQQAVFDQGHEVGELARQYCTGGVLLSHDHNDIAGALEETQKLIDGGDTMLYEAAFQAGGILVRCDILKKVSEAWHLSASFR